MFRWNEYYDTIRLDDYEDGWRVWPIGWPGNFKTMETLWLGFACIAPGST